jgi:hypothetical protein
VRDLAPADLLAAWERGWARPLSDRAIALLDATDRPGSLDELSVGQCDARLYAVRAQLFGDDLALVGRCPVCGERVDVELSLSAVAPDPDLVPDSSVIVEHEGRRVECRVPSNADFRALAARGSQLSARDVVARCRVPEPRSDPDDDLDDRLVSEVLERLVETDPGAHVCLDVTCPCGATWAEPLDIRTVLWDELGTWVTELLHDVHHLASVYGWSEAEVLALSPWRRDWYRRAVGW